MFGLLKNKISSFITNITKKSEAEAEISDKKEDEAKQDIPKEEEKKVDEAKAEEKKAEDKKQEVPKVEEKKHEEKKVEEKKVEEKKTEPISIDPKKEVTLAHPSEAIIVSAPKPVPAPQAPIPSVSPLPSAPTSRTTEFSLAAHAKPAQAPVQVSAPVHVPSKPAESPKTFAPVQHAEARNSREFLGSARSEADSTLMKKPELVSAPKPKPEIAPTPIIAPRLEPKKLEVPKEAPKKIEVPKEIPNEVHKEAPKIDSPKPKLEAPKEAPKIDIKPKQPVHMPVPKVEAAAEKIAIKPDPKIEPKSDIKPEHKHEPKKEKKGLVDSITQFIPMHKATPVPAAPERKLDVNLSIESRVRSIFSSEVEIKEKDVGGLLEDLHMSLLESDVAYEVAETMVGSIREKLVGKKVEKRKLNDEVKGAIHASIVEVLSSDRQFNLIDKVRSLGKPAKLLFVGPNGAGKTTTMAKLAHLFMKNGLNSVFSASDTFRAAAIEQTEEHGRRLGIRTIKSAYGADPASVAFDSVSYAKAHNIEVVLIDSAGRQETNANLIGELKKINRVVKPDLKLYIGESIAGNALLEQVKAFDEAIGLDGVILTKLDCDAKGGTALSITKATNIPILYIGVGQAYEDLKEFSANEIADEIIGAS